MLKKNYIVWHIFLFICICILIKLNWIKVFNWKLAVVIKQVFMILIIWLNTVYTFFTNYHAKRKETSGILQCTDKLKAKIKLFLSSVNVVCVFSFSAIPWTINYHRHYSQSCQIFLKRPYLVSNWYWQDPMSINRSYFFNKISQSATHQNILPYSYSLTNFSSCLRTKENSICYQNQCHSFKGSPLCQSKFKVNERQSFGKSMQWSGQWQNLSFQGRWQIEIFKGKIWGISIGRPQGIMQKIACMPILLLQRPHLNHRINYSAFQLFSWLENISNFFPFD